MENKITTITSEEAGQIIEDRKQLGLFLLAKNRKYIGIDNSNGQAWTEEFDSIFICRHWLRGKTQSGDFETLLLIKQLKAPIFLIWKT